MLYGITSDLLNRLQRFQNCVARLILKKRKHDQITPLLIELHWLPVEFRIQFKLAVFALQHFDGTLPLYLSSVLHSLRSSSEKLLKTPRVNMKSAGERSFCYAASAVWNSFPNSIRNVPTLTTFKRQLKTHLFRKAFPNS